MTKGKLYQPDYFLLLDHTKDIPGVSVTFDQDSRYPAIFRLVWVVTGTPLVLQQLEIPSEDLLDFFDSANPDRTKLYENIKTIEHGIAGVILRLTRNGFLKEA